MQNKAGIATFTASYGQPRNDRSGHRQRKSEVVHGPFRHVLAVALGQ